MGGIKVKFKLKSFEKDKIKIILRKGKESVRVIRRARVLELFDQGLTSPTVAKYVGVTAETARRIGWNYMKEGIDSALYDKPRPGKEKLLTKKQENMIIALVCSDPPEGKSRWTIMLLKEEAIKRKIVNSVGRETIRVLLKSHGLKPWREKNVVHPRTR